MSSNRVNRVLYTVALGPAGSLPAGGVDAVRTMSAGPSSADRSYDDFHGRRGSGRLTKPRPGVTVVR